MKGEFVMDLVSGIAYIGSYLGERKYQQVRVARKEEQPEQRRKDGEASGHEGEGHDDSRIGRNIDVDA